MTKKTGDDLADTRDERANIDSVDPNVETKILTPDQDAYETRKISDPDQWQQQGKPPENPFSSTATIGDYRIIRKIG